MFFSFFEGNRHFVLRTIRAVGVQSHQFPFITAGYVHVDDGVNFTTPLFNDLYGYIMNIRMFLLSVHIAIHMLCNTIQRYITK